MSTSDIPPPVPPQFMTTLKSPIVDEDRVYRRIRQGWASAGILAGLSLILWTAAMIFHPTGSLQYLDDPWLGLDVVLISGLAFGIYHRSRFCAVSLFGYALMTRLHDVVMLERFTTIPTGLVFLYFHFQGIVGTIQYHRYLKTRAKRRSSLWSWVLRSAAGVLGLAVVLLLAIGFMTEFRILPDTLVVTGDKLTSRQLRQLREIGVVSESEKILYFYSAGVLSIKEDGNFFTSERVVSYSMDEGDLWIGEAMFDDIVDLRFQKSDSIWTDSVITVTPHDEDEFILFVTIEEDGDETFYSALQEVWQESR